jgi:threonine synthase
MIAAATAHPAKFPDAIERAIGSRPPLPRRLADLYQRPERYTRAPNDLAAIETLVRAIVQRKSA